MEQINTNDESVKRNKISKRKFIIEDVIIKDNEKLEPCLVQFSNGYVKDGSEIQGKLFRHASEKYKHKRSRRIFEATTSRLKYTGKNFEEAVDKNFEERNFLGVLDKNTNKMKLIEISSFLLHPETSSTVPKSVNFLANMNMKEKRKELNLEFGGRKARKSVKRTEENDFDIDEMVEALSNSTKNVDVDVELDFQLDDEEEAYKEILPPCNRDASLIYNVYKVEDIIPDVQLVLYNDEAMEYLDGNKDASKLSILFKQTIANAKLSTDEEESAKLACLALFTENLVEYLRTLPRLKPKFTSCPKAMESKIYEMFSEGKQRKRSKTLEDKLIAHILVLAFLSNQLHLEWTTLCRSLVIQKDRLTNLLGVIGATMKDTSGTIVLKLPLAKLKLAKPKPRNHKLKMRR